MEKKKNKVYFGKEQEESIRNYVYSNDRIIREKLYIEKIYPAIAKLVENIIFRYDFLKLTDKYVNLHHEVVTHIYLNLDKFDPARGTKAYSYFGTAAKRYLKQKSINKTFEDKNIENIHIEDRKDLDESINSAILIKTDEEKNANDVEFINILINELENIVRKIEIEKAEGRQKDENEQKITEAIIYFLKHYKGINIHNKKHFYLLIREYTGLDTKTITRILNKNIIKVYNVLKKKYDNYEL
jgi:hypothetical protein